MSDHLCILNHRKRPDDPPQAEPGAYLCFGHLNNLGRNLRDLAGLYDDLGENLESAGGSGQRVSGTAEIGLRINLTIVDLRAAIRDGLASWARVVCEDRDVNPPADDVAAIGAFLAVHGPWIGSQPFVAELWAELIHDPSGSVTRERDTRALTQRAHSALQPSTRRKAELEGARCPGECGGALVALVRDVDDVLPSKVWCEACGAEWTSSEWMTLGRAIRKAVA